MLNSVGKAHSREIGSAEASIHSIISIVVASKLHAVIEARPLGAKVSRRFEPFSCYRGFTKQEGIMDTLSGLAAVRSISPSVAIAGPLEKPVRSASCAAQKNKWTAVLLKNCR